MWPFRDEQQPHARVGAHHVSLSLKHQRAAQSPAENRQLRKGVKVEKEYEKKSKMAEQINNFRNPKEIQFS